MKDGEKQREHHPIFGNCASYSRVALNGSYADGQIAGTPRCTTGALAAFFGNSCLSAVCKRKHPSKGDCFFEGCDRETCSERVLIRASDGSGLQEPFNGIQPFLQRLHG